MRPVALVGAYKKQSVSLEPSERINLVPILNPKGVRAQKAYYLRPGLALFGQQSGASACRGAIANADESEGYVVIDNKLYEVATNGTLTERDTLTASTGRVSMALGVDSLMTVDDGDDEGYKFVPSTNTATDISDADFPEATFVTYLKTRFLFIETSTGKIWMTAIDDPSDITATDFATAEYQPDNLVAVAQAKENVYLLGKKTIEIWYSTSEDFPFSPRQSIDTGCLAAGSVVEFTRTVAEQEIGSVVFAGTSRTGGGVQIYVLTDYSCQVISQDIDNILETYTTTSDLIGFVFREKGQTFYVLTSPTHNDTFVYCFEAQEWCEWQDSNGDRFVATCYMRLNGKHIVGARNSGKLFELSFDTLADDSVNFNWTLVFPLGTESRLRKHVTRLQMDMQTGTGTGSSNEQTVNLYVSRDGGNSYGSARAATAGTQNDYTKRVFWNRVTCAYSPTMKISGASGNVTRLFNPHAEYWEGGR
jgi:hypothetical protein